MPIAKKQHDVVTLVDSAAVTATSAGTDAVRLPTIDVLSAIAFTLDVTVAATTVGDTLNLAVQTMLDGSNWTDVVRFTLVLGNGSAVRHIEKIRVGADEAGFEVGSALGAGAVRNLLGDEYRCIWTIVDETADNASFTFSVHAQPM